MIGLGVFARDSVIIHLFYPVKSTLFQMEYVVQSGDTLERIAASHDCTVGEVMKLNRMAARMVRWLLYFRKTRFRGSNS